MISKEEAQKALDSLKADDRDLYVYSGGISQENFSHLIGILVDAKSRRKRAKASLVLTTHGGDPNHAYRIARLFQDWYGKGEEFRLVVLGPCKSAGTLIAVGAGELAMNVFGELGPLDVQVAKLDEIAVRTSGLDTLGALAILQSEAFNAFEKYMVTIVAKSGRTVSTKTACDIAATIVSGLFEPIAKQIDPHRLSEVDRMMRIAKKYGERLGTPNLKTDDAGSSLDRLIRGYPTHDFIIDSNEASEIFEVVKPPSDAEQLAFKLFPHEVMYPDEEKEATICDVVEKLESIVGDASLQKEQPDQPKGRRRASARSSKGTGGGTPAAKEGIDSGESVAVLGPNGSESPPVDRR